MANRVTGVYCILNTVDQKKYIGSSFDVCARIGGHKVALLSKSHHSIHLQAAIKQWERIKNA